MITQDELNGYLKAVGKKGMETLKVIHALRPFIEAQESELGQEFLKEDMEEFANLFNKIFDSLIADGTAKQEDVIKLRLLYGRVKRIAVRLDAYRASVEKVKQIKK